MYKFNSAICTFRRNLCAFLIYLLAFVELRMLRSEGGGGGEVCFSLAQ